MTYPASPSGGAPSRVRLDAAQFWAGAAATAVVAALIALVGILISRWALNIPIIAPAGDGAWGNANTAVYVFLSLVVAVVAASVLNLLVLGTPQPTMFFDWMMTLATLAAAVYPFSTSAPLDQKAATAILNLVLGIAVTSLLNAVASRAIRRPVPTVPSPRADYLPEQPDQQPYAGNQPYQDEQGYVPEQQRRYPPTQPINVPRDRPQRRYP